MKILIAEDDHVSRVLLESLLSGWGYNVASAHDGAEALRLWKEMPDLSLAVLDWIMPKIDGLGVCREIRKEIDRPAYIVMLTSRVEHKELLTAFDRGVDDYVTKPFIPAELRVRIKSGERIVSLDRELRRRVQELEDEKLHVSHLRAIVPICSHCKKTRNDNAYWNEVDNYLARFGAIQTNQPACPECAHKISLSKSRLD
ncbi:MAG: response regulator transcription factor [Candidatus Zixiibacteriota bacterium]